MEKIKNILSQKEFLDSEISEEYKSAPVVKNDKRIAPVPLNENEKVKKYDDFIKRR